MPDPLAGRDLFFLLKGAAEVGKTAVADFEGGFGDIAAAGGDEIGGAVDAGAADPEHEGAAGDLGEGAAQVVGAATGSGGEGVEVVGFVELGQDTLFDPFDALAGGAFGTGDDGGGRRGLADGVRLEREELPDEEVGEAGFVEQAAGGFAQVGGHEAARPGEVVLGDRAQGVEQRRGLRDDGANRCGELRKEVAKVLGEPGIWKDEGEALVAVPGEGAGSAAGGAGEGDGAGWEVGERAGRESELGEAVEVEMEAKSLRVKGLRPRVLGSLGALAGVPEAGRRGEWD